ncbi:hypothetical protein [Bacillus altitudinis]|uniref:hypothetical protein n=1 Tax=Bacillus altitudinis TaxID=293387 RepID=UPI002E1CC44D|nr:hypothetical protein [Bacillus altitudinis]
MKKFVFIILFSFLFLFSCFSIYNRLINGDMMSREELLRDTIFELVKEDYSEKDIIDIDIKYNFIKGGSIPYEAYVKIKDKDDVFIYSWVDKERAAVEKVGITSE